MRPITEEFLKILEDRVNGEFIKPKDPQDIFEKPTDITKREVRDLLKEFRKNIIIPLP